MKRAFASTVALLVLALAGCSTDEQGVTAVGAEGSNRAPGDPHGPAPDSPPGPEYSGNLPDPRYPVRAEPAGDIYEWGPAANFAQFVKLSNAAIIGRVSGISPARWNTPDGSTPAEGPDAMKFRDATVMVDEVVFDSSTLPVKAGETMTVRLLGDGTPTGSAIDGAEGIRYFNEISGPVAVGDRVLWVLGLAKFPLTDGTTVATPKLAADYFGSWIIGADVVARSLVPARTVPLAALVAKFRTERATPTDAGTGSRGKVNPLE